MLLRMLLLGAMAASAAAQHHGMDPFAGSKCTCDTFCDGSCDVADVGAKQMMTQYRMTQFGVVDMTNKNTGDVPGDTSFVISRRTQAYECRQNPSSYQVPPQTTGGAAACSGSGSSSCSCSCSCSSSGSGSPP